MRYALKAVFMLGALGSLLASPRLVSAADLPEYGGSRQRSSSPVFAGAWTGFYGGAHAGYASSSAPPAKLEGFLLGLHLGGNLQYDRIVVGGEADLSYTNIDYNAFSESFRQKWLASARGRLGYSFEQVMPFITLGAAYTSAEMKMGGLTASNGHFGLVLGAGVEALLTEKVSANVQFLHYRFGKEQYTVYPIKNTDITMNTLRLGVNYKF